jgi:hypothetical protein
VVGTRSNFFSCPVVSASGLWTSPISSEKACVTGQTRLISFAGEYGGIKVYDFFGRPSPGTGTASPTMVRASVTIGRSSLMLPGRVSARGLRGCAGALSVLTVSRSVSSFELLTMGGDFRIPCAVRCEPGCQELAIHS